VTLRERIQGLSTAATRWYGRHTASEQRIILSVAVLAVLSILYVGVVVPVRDFRAGVADEITDGQEQLERAARYIGATDSLRAEREALKKRLQQARARLLPGRTGTLGAAALQERTNAIAAEKGVTVQSTQVMREETVQPYHKVSVRLTLSGELKPFADMVSTIEYGQQLAIPFAEMSRRGAVPGAKGPRTLTATLEVSGFVLAEEAKPEDNKGDEDKPNDAAQDVESAPRPGTS
jgi:Tfp pilus assembly protein PilO